MKKAVLVALALLIMAPVANAQDLTLTKGTMQLGGVATFDIDMNMPEEGDSVTGFALNVAPGFGYFIMEGSPYLEVLLYDALLYDEIKLKSDPVHVGVLPESTYAYVNQEHDLGRLSFYEPDEGVVKTITGFELNSGIEH